MNSLSESIFFHTLLSDSQTANMQPNLITLWPGQFRVQNIISLINWRLDKGVYPAKLLFYPNLPGKKDDSDKISFRSSSVAYGDDSIITRGRERGWREPKPPTRRQRLNRSRTLMTCLRKHQLTASSAKGSLYKRTISAAIPSTEEDVAVDDGLRKSARPRKPKTRN